MRARNDLNNAIDSRSILASSYIWGHEFGWTHSVGPARIVTSPERRRPIRSEANSLNEGSAQRL